MSKTDHIKFLVVRHYDKKIRLGRDNDGGYVIADLPFSNNSNECYDCYISAGVSNEESFSRDFIKKYNMNELNSFAFDGTIKNYPYEYTRNISFINKNIDCINTDNLTNLSEFFERYNNIFLKMDIEGGEIPWLCNLTLENLKKIKQLTIEFHFINGTSDYEWGSSYSDKIKCFEKLSTTHYIIHAHGNNNAGTVNSIPDVIELTYLRKDNFTTEPDINKIKLPLDTLDTPNNPCSPDIDLSSPPFTFN